MRYHDELARVIRTVIEPDARETDTRSRFPRAAVRALGDAGVLGLTVSRRLGGGGEGLRAAAAVVELLARACGSTATVLQAHYGAVAVLEDNGPRWLREEVAAGRHLSSLALTEADVGGEAYPAATPGTEARVHGGVVDLRARKTWVPAAGEADSYVWSSRSADGPEVESLWLVPAHAPGLFVPSDHDAIGLRGSAGVSVTADPVRVPADALLGEHGDGARIVRELVSPWLFVLGAAVSMGLMESTVAVAVDACRRAGARRHGALADTARMRVRVDSVRALLEDALDGVARHRPDRDLSLLTLRAAATEAAAAVTELGMKVCGASASHTSLGIERRFRDARAAAAIEPTPDTALDRIGQLLLTI